MKHREIVCPLCARPVAPDDTVVFGHGHLSHLDCRQPQALTPEERALLSVYCRAHAVAECVACAKRYRPSELVASTGPGQHRCPQCGASLLDSMRAHLYGCAMFPEEVLRRAHAARAAASELVKRSRQLHETADMLVTEAEAAFEALRAAMRQSPVLRQ
jgi:hypothetical protein